MLEHRPSPVAVLNVVRLRGEHQGAAIRVHQGLTVATLHLLARVVAPWPAAFVVFRLRVSSTAAVGEASRPTRSRSNMTKWWFTLPNKLPSR